MGIAMGLRNRAGVKRRFAEIAEYLLRDLGAGRLWVAGVTPS